MLCDDIVISTVFHHIGHSFLFLLHLWYQQQVLGVLFCYNLV